MNARHSRRSWIPNWIKPRCSQCGHPWQDCPHALYEDIYRHKLWTVLKSAAFTMIALVAVGVCVVLPLMALFS